MGAREALCRIFTSGKPREQGLSALTIVGMTRLVPRYGIPSATVSRHAHAMPQPTQKEYPLVVDEESEEMFVALNEEQDVTLEPRDGESDEED